MHCHFRNLNLGLENSWERFGWDQSQFWTNSTFQIPVKNEAILCQNFIPPARSKLGSKVRTLTYINALWINYLINSQGESIVKSWSWALKPYLLFASWGWTAHGCSRSWIWVHEGFYAWSNKVIVGEPWLTSTHKLELSRQSHMLDLCRHILYVRITSTLELELCRQILQCWNYVDKVLWPDFYCIITLTDIVSPSVLIKFLFVNFTS